MSGGNRTLAELAGEFVGTLSSEEASICQQEVSRFVRWFGSDRPIAQLSAPAIGSYTEEVENSKIDYNQRLKPVRDFLAYLKKQGVTDINFAVHVRIKKANTKKGPGIHEMHSKAVHLTEQGHAKLQEERRELISMRPKIAEELKRARADKDFRENAPLDAARDHQAHVEAKIREIESTLKAAVIIRDEHLNSEKISIGSTVVVHDISFDEEVRYTLVSPSEIDLKSGKISIASPLGKSLLDRIEGEEIDVSAPAGMMKYRVLKVVR